MIRVLKNKETGKYTVARHNALWIGIPGWEYHGSYDTKREAEAAKKRLEKEVLMKIHHEAYKR